MTEVGEGRLYLVTPAEYATLYDGGAKDGTVTSNGVTYAWDDNAVYAQIPQFGTGLDLDENYLITLAAATEFSLGGVMAAVPWDATATLPVQINESGAMYVDALSTAAAAASFISAVTAYSGTSKTLSLAVTKNGVTTNVTVPYATNAMYGTDSSGVSDERAVSYEYLHKPAGTDTTTETYAAYVPEQSADITTYSITTTVSSSSTDSQLPTAKSVWTLSQNIGNLTLVTYDGSPTVSSAFPYFVVADNSTGAQQLKTVSFATMKTMPYFIPWGTVYDTSNSGTSIAAGGGSVAGASGQAYTRASSFGYSSSASYNSAVAFGAYSSSKGTQTIAVGDSANAGTGTGAVAIGGHTLASADRSIAIGLNSYSLVANWFSIDAISWNRVYSAYTTDNIFFRNAIVSSSITTQAGYTTGYTLTQALEGAALLLNGTAELTTRDEKAMLINDVIDGNFSDSSKWTVWNSSYTTISIASNEATVTISTDSTADYLGIRSTYLVSAVSGHLYYRSVMIKNQLGSTRRFEIDAANDLYFVASVPVSSSFVRYSYVQAAASSAATARFVVLPRYDSTAFTAGTYFSVQDYVSIDLTAVFGSGREPTKAEMDEILLKLFPSTNGWFDGSDTRLIDSQYLENYVSLKYVPYGTMYGTGAGNLAAGNESITGVSGQNYTNMTALGRLAYAEYGGATAVGYNAQAMGTHAVALGDTSVSSAYGSTALGWTAAASGNYSVALGEAASATIRNALAAGNYASASGDSAISLGAGSLATGADASALGAAASAVGDHSLALGSYADAYIPNIVCFDGYYSAGAYYNRTLLERTTDNVFFRNVDVSTSITSLAGYTTGATLTSYLNGTAPLWTGTAIGTDYVATHSWVVNTAVAHATMYGTDISSVLDENPISYEYIHRPGPGSSYTDEAYAAYVPEQAASTSYSIVASVTNDASAIPTAAAVYAFASQAGSLVVSTSSASATPYYLMGVATLTSASSQTVYDYAGIYVLGGHLYDAGGIVLDNTNYTNYLSRIIYNDSNASLEGIKIGDVSYKVVPVGTRGNSSSSLAIGGSSITSGSQDTAIGTGASVTGGNVATAIGYGAIVSGAGSTSIGGTASAYGAYNVSIGCDAIGGTSTSSISYAIAIGASAKVLVSGGISIGMGAQSTTNGAIAIGSENTLASGVMGIAIGWDAQAVGAYSICLGHYARTGIPYAFNVDGTGSVYANHIFLLYDPTKIFFRYANNMASYTSLSQYTSGVTLQSLLDAKLSVSTASTTYISRAGVSYDSLTETLTLF